MSARRTAAHAAIRAAGYGDKLDRLIVLLAEHRATFDEALRLSERPSDDAAKEHCRQQVAREARAGLNAIDRTLDAPQLSGSAYGSLGDWGENGSAPRVRSVLRSARFHAEELAHA